MRKEQLIRGKVKPKPFQVITIHQTTKQERDQRVTESWWIAFADPQAPRREDFAAEVARRASERVERQKPYAPQIKRPAPQRATQCVTAGCGKPLTADQQRKGLTRCRACRKARPGIVTRRIA